jgi:hypothetical protein
VHHSRRVHREIVRVMQSEKVADQSKAPPKGTLLYSLPLQPLMLRGAGRRGSISISPSSSCAGKGIEGQRHEEPPSLAARACVMCTGIGHLMPYAKASTSAALAISARDRARCGRFPIERHPSSL